MCRLLVLCLLALECLVSNEARGQALVFERDVAPILTAYCWKCHGAEASKADLDMRSFPLLIKGGRSGAAIVRGSTEKSLLFQRLSKGEMPPDGELKPSNKHLELVKAWIEAGAPAQYEVSLHSEIETPPITDQQRNWWAFRKPVRSPIPVVLQTDRARTAIDAFLLARLEQHQIGFSPDAEFVTLARRVYFDLIGLPPSPEVVDAFVADPSPRAYEQLVDRLLASPQYGVRWGRHWLDAAGYVDTRGTDDDADRIKVFEGMWKYRDYVVQSFNEDKPYDRFLLEQIAGDELVDWRSAERFTPEIKRSLIATGFLRQAADATDEDVLNTADIRHQVIYDTVQILSTNVLGLTLHCARCHNHKFDPISQLDYYRVAACFTPSYNVHNWRQTPARQLHEVSTSEKKQIDDENAKIDAQINEVEKEIAEFRRPTQQKLLDGKLATIPEVIRADTKAAIDIPAEERGEVQKYLADKLGPLLKVDPAEVEKSIPGDVRANIARASERIAELKGRKQSYGQIQALWEVGPPPPTYLYRRGDYTTPGPQVEPGIIGVLDDPATPLPFSFPPRDPQIATSGRRMAMARWLTQPDHPLTARVIVNRVWQQYFGRGIVATPDNFGSSGAEPTHPKLLDWLATELVQSGWSFKHLHRSIVTSTAYRQASTVAESTADPKSISKPKSPQSIDPENGLLWRMPLRRLESEAIRDRILAVSGALDARVGGPPLPIKPNPDASVRIDTDKLAPGTSPFRRSLYVFARRNYQLSELGTFDQPAVAHNCTRRTSSAVVLQSLMMLNSEFVFDQAERFATRVRARAGNDGVERIHWAFRFALSREPLTEELVLGQELLGKQTARYQDGQQLSVQQASGAALVDLCQMLLNSNEFLYLE